MTGNLLLCIGLLVLAAVGLVWVLWEYQQLGNEIADLDDLIRGLVRDIEHLAADLTEIENHLPTTAGGRIDATPVPLAMHGPWAPTTEELPAVGRHRAPKGAK